MGVAGEVGWEGTMGGLMEGRGVEVLEHGLHFNIQWIQDMRSFGGERGRYHLELSRHILSHAVKICALPHGRGFSG